MGGGADRDLSVGVRKEPGCPRGWAPADYPVPWAHPADRSQHRARVIWPGSCAWWRWRVRRQPSRNQQEKENPSQR